MQSTPGPPTFTIQSRPSAAASLRAYHLGALRRARLFSILPGLVLVLTGIFLIVVSQVHLDPFVTIEVGALSMAIGGGILITELSPYPSPVAKRLWAETRQGGTVTFDPDGVRTETPYMVRTYRWDAFTAVRADGHVAVFMRGAAMLMWVEAADFANRGQFKALIAFARAQIAGPAPAPWPSPDTTA